MYTTRVYKMSSSDCLLCFVFEQPKRRRRLYRPSSSQVLAVLTSLASADVLSGVLSTKSRSDTAPVYLCRKCFTAVEKVYTDTAPVYLCRKCFTAVGKVYRARKELAKLEDDVVKKIRCCCS